MNHICIYQVCMLYNAVAISFAIIMLYVCVINNSGPETASFVLHIYNENCLDRPTCLFSKTRPMLGVQK